MKIRMSTRKKMIVSEKIRKVEELYSKRPTADRPFVYSVIDRLE